MSVFSVILAGGQEVGKPNRDCDLALVDMTTQLSASEVDCLLDTLDLLNQEESYDFVLEKTNQMLNAYGRPEDIRFQRILAKRNACYLKLNLTLIAFEELKRQAFSLDSLSLARPQEDWDPLLAETHLNLAICYQNVSEPEKGEPHLNMAFGIFEERGDTINLSRATMLRAGFFLFIYGEMDSTLVYFERAAELADTQENIDLKLMCMGNLAGIYSQIGDTAKSEYWYMRAVRIPDSENHPEMFSFVRANLAQLLRGMKRYDEAFYYLNMADTLLENYPKPYHFERGHTSRGLAALARVLGDDDLELKSLKNVLKSDSLYNAELLAKSLDRTERYYDQKNEIAQENELSQELEREQELNALQWLLFFVAIVIAGTAFYTLMQIRKKNRLLENITTSLRLKGEELGIANDKIIQINQTLEHKVNERTAELLNANSSLRKSERNSRLANFTVEQVAIAIFWFDQKGQYIKLNDQVEKIFGYTNEEILSLRTEDFDADQDTFDFKEFWTETKRQKNWIIERRLRKKGGQEFAAEIYSHHLEFDGDEYICAFVINVEGRKQDQLKLEVRYRYERHISKQANGLINSSAEDLDKVIVNTLAETAKLLGADRSYFIMYDELSESYSLTHSWAAKDEFKPDLAKYTNVPTDSNSLYEQHERNKPLIIPNVEDLPETYLSEKQAMLNDNIKSTYMVPNYVEGKKFGFAGMDSLTTPKSWGKDELNIFKILGQIIATTIERNRKQQILETSRNRTELALEAGEVAMWEGNFAKGERFYSSSFFQILPIKKDILENMNTEEWLQHVHPHDRVNFKTQWRRALKDPEVNRINVDFRMIGREENKWLNLQGKVTKRGKDGRVLVARGILKDITEGRKKESEFIKLNRQLAALIENLPGIVYRITNDENYTINFLSQSFESITGYPVEEFINKKRSKWLKIMHPDDFEAGATEPELQKREEGNYRYSYRLISKTGSMVYCYDQGLPIRDEHGKVIGFEGYITDVTSKVKADERIMAVHLEAEDKERRRIARELHDSLGQTLTAINFNFDALKKRVEFESDDSEKLYERAMGLLDQAIRETRDISHGIMPKDIDDFGFVMATQSMLDGFRSISAMKFHFFDNLQGERLPHNLELNLFRITQEAVTNAIKYAEAGEVTVQLMRYANDLILTIEDDGKGFNLASLATRGTSLGVRNMRNRATAFSGEFIFDSSIGHGTSITINIPLKD